MIIFKYQYVLCKKRCGKPLYGFIVNPSNYTDFTKVCIDQRSKIKCFKRVEAKDIKGISSFSLFSLFILTLVRLNTLKIE